MLALSPSEFEAFTRELLASSGFSLRLNGGPGDLGADLVGRDPKGRSTIVQCKRYDPGQKVGSQALQTFIGMRSIHHRADRGIVVTTSGFTSAAIELAKAHDIWLIDGGDLVRLQRRWQPKRR